MNARTHLAAGDAPTARRLHDAAAASPFGPRGKRQFGPDRTGRNAMTIRIVRKNKTHRMVRGVAEAVAAPVAPQPDATSEPLPYHRTLIGFTARRQVGWDD